MQTKAYAEAAIVAVPAANPSSPSVKFTAFVVPNSALKKSKYNIMPLNESLG